MKFEDFEIQLEKEERKKSKASKIKKERWYNFWYICDNVSRVSLASALPIILCVGRKKYNLKDCVILYDDDKAIFQAFDNDGKLIVFVLGMDRNVVLVCNDKVMYGQVVDINEKDDPEIPERMILTCQAEDVTFKVTIG